MNKYHRSLKDQAHEAKRVAFRLRRVYAHNPDSPILKEAEIEAGYRLHDLFLISKTT